MSITAEIVIGRQQLIGVKFTRVKTKYKKKKARIILSAVICALAIVLFFNHKHKTTIACDLLTQNIEVLAQSEKDGEKIGCYTKISINHYDVENGATYNVMYCGTCKLLPASACGYTALCEYSIY